MGRRTVLDDRRAALTLRTFLAQQFRTIRSLCELLADAALLYCTLLAHTFPRALLLATAAGASASYIRRTQPTTILRSLPSRSSCAHTPTLLRYECHRDVAPITATYDCHQADGAAQETSATSTILPSTPAFRSASARGACLSRLSLSTSALSRHRSVTAQ